MCNLFFTWHQSFSNSFTRVLSYQKHSLIWNYFRRWIILRGTGLGCRRVLLLLNNCDWNYLLSFLNVTFGLVLAMFKGFITMQVGLWVSCTCAKLCTPLESLLPSTRLQKQGASSAERSCGRIWLRSEDIPSFWLDDNYVCVEVNYFCKRFIMISTQLKEYLKIKTEDGDISLWFW